MPRASRPATRVGVGPSPLGPQPDTAGPVPALPGVRRAGGPAALFRIGGRRQHGHPPEHVILDEMVPDAADHEEDPRLRERHDFHAVAGVEARVRSPVEAVRRIINQQHPRRRAGGRGGLLDSDGLQRRPLVIDDDLMQATDDKVDRAPGRDGHVRRDHLVVIPLTRDGHRPAPM
jgi:hypothetical protein